MPGLGGKKKACSRDGRIFRHLPPSRQIRYFCNSRWIYISAVAHPLYHHTVTDQQNTMYIHNVYISHFVAAYFDLKRLRRSLSHQTRAWRKNCVCSVCVTSPQNKLVSEFHSQIHVHRY